MVIVGCKNSYWVEKGSNKEMTLNIYILFLWPLLSF